jgi:hypothetical protein
MLTSIESPEIKSAETVVKNTMDIAKKRHKNAGTVEAHGIQKPSTRKR